MKESNILIPNMISSIKIPNYFSIKTILLKDIDLNSDKIKNFVKLFPYLYIFSGTTSYSHIKYLVVEIYYNPNWDKLMNESIKSFFTILLIHSFGILSNP